MIKLYGYDPAWELPDCSPLVAKVDCYLRMVGLPYTLVSWHSFQDLQNAPKGKFPYIEDNNKKIADSSFIITYLKATYGEKLGDHTLSSRDQAIAHSMQRMMEENLYWVITYSQWMEDAAWEAYTHLSAILRPDLRIIAVQVSSPPSARTGRKHGPAHDDFGTDR